MRRASSRTPTSSRRASRRIASNSSTLVDPNPARVMPGDHHQVGPLQTVPPPGVSTSGGQLKPSQQPAEPTTVEPDQAVTVGPKQANILTEPTRVFASHDR